jgi:hypothetical protein
MSCPLRQIITILREFFDADPNFKKVSYVYNCMFFLCFLSQILNLSLSLSVIKLTERIIVLNVLALSEMQIDNGSVDCNVRCQPSAQ